MSTTMISSYAVTRLRISMASLLPAKVTDSGHNICQRVTYKPVTSAFINLKEPNQWSSIGNQNLTKISTTPWGQVCFRLKCTLTLILTTKSVAAANVFAIQIPSCDNFLLRSAKIPLNLPIAKTTSFTSFFFSDHTTEQTLQFNNFSHTNAKLCSRDQ